MPTILKKITVFTLVFLTVFISTGLTHIFATGDSNSSSLNCDANTNLVIDGGFETPIITNPKLWDIVSIPTVESPWISAYSNYGLEIQAGVHGWLPASGAQYAEIDGGIGHEISQVIPTTLGNTYTFSFVTSPRPDVPVATSSMNVLVNNTLLETVNSPATTTSQTEWHSHSYTFTATGTSTKITFVDSKPISTGTGIFLDTVKVICSGQPAVTNPPASTCDANTNLILDGGFEKPIITNPKLWDVVAIPTQDAPWMSTYSNYGLEIQAGVGGWLPVEGTQYAEIDGGSGHQVFQTISTVPGNTYSLSFVTSPRPDISTATSSMNVLINDVLKDTINSSGPIVSQTAWLPHTYTFVATGTSTKITFVDSKPLSTGTGIFLDKVNVTCTGAGQPAVNTSPTVTLVGANPVTVTVGQTYTDLGATATDQEDGNLTAHIIASSTVNTNVVGTYTVTYSVTDSGGLSATPVTRTVNVVAASTLSCVITSPTQTGWYGTYFNYSSTALGMELPMSQWGTTYGDPLGSVTPWTANWYNSQFARFNRVDSALTFGDNFFPFDSAPEEIINGHEYHFGVHEAATVTATTTGSYKYTLTSDDDAWVYVDGRLVGDNSGVHTPTTLIGTTTLTSGLHTVDIFFAERHTIQSSFAFAFEDTSLSIKPYSSLCTMNHPPVITLTGANPVTVTVGQTYTDAGATATDQEDGNLTAHIVVTGTIGTTTPGTYALTYSVTDSGGLSATTTRQVVVSNPVTPPSSGPQCSIFDTLGDTQSEVIGQSNVASELTLPSILSGAGFASINVSGDQKQYQSLTLSQSSTTVTVTVIDSETAAGDVFGYYVNNDATNFVPLFLVGSGTNTTYPSLSRTNPGSTFTFTVGNYNSIQFAIQRTPLSPSSISIISTVNAQNGGDRVLAYDVPNQNGSYILAFEDLPIGSSDNDYNDVVVKVSVVSCALNTPPVITLTGANPATVNMGDTFIDPGATATDQEDGNITSHIIATSTVNTSAAGTYAISYSVTDSGGLSASTTRQVIVQNPNSGGPTTGKITFCLVLADNNNKIATSSVNLPSGIFSLNFASSTSISSSTLSSRTWNAMSFTPNTKIILSTGQDAQCQTVDNLPFGSYYYSPLSVSGLQWNAPKYNDQNSQPVNNVFDFFLYSPELFTATTTDDAVRNLNSDGNIVLDASNRDRTLVMYDTYNPAPQCSLPTVSSSLTASVTVNNAFTYTLTGSTTSATTTPLTFSVATSTLPAGLSFATSTNTISGTPTQTGTYNIALKAENTCGFDIQTLVLTVLAGSTGGGGGTPGADIVVTKTADKTTANVGENITYTITVANNGSLDATNVAVTDILPSTLTFVSSTSPVGNYATSTGIWTVGNLLNGSSTVLTLVAKINAGTEGQKITNTAVVSSTQSDPNTANNTTSADTTVNTPATTPACSANCGGGGGGGGGGNGPIVPNTLTIFNEQVVETVPGVAFVTWNTTLPATRRVVYGNGSNASLGLAPNYGYTNSTDLVGTPVLTQHGMAIAIVPGQTYYFRPVSTNGTDTAIGKELTLNPATTTGGTTGGSTSNSCYYLYDFLRKDFNNNPVEVKKLQFFLKTLEGFSNLEVTGVYDDATIAATDAFQIRYKDEILTPWGYDGTQGTDYTYILTKKKVNEIYCQHAFPVTPLEQAEIDATRALFESLRNAGIEVGNPPPATTTPTPLENNVVGTATTSGSSFGLNSTTLGGISSTTRDIASRMTANVLSAGRTLGSLALAFFAWPFGSSTWDSLLNGIKTLGNNFLSWLILSLILALIVISYLWYREYKNNKKIEEIKQIEEINKEIDLK